MRIVIVDDHPLVRQGLQAVLAMEDDIEVAAEAGTVEEAVTAIFTCRPDLVLLDVRLPGENGLEVIDRCRRRFTKPKFLVLTSAAEEHSFRQAEEAGVEGYVLKDAPPEELLYAIRLVAKGRRYFDASMLDMILHGEKGSPLQALTPREREVLDKLGQGLSNREIAEQLYISESTVKKHVSQILAKLEVKDRTQAALLANSHAAVRLTSTK